MATCQLDNSQTSVSIVTLKRTKSSVFHLEGEYKVDLHVLRKEKVYLDIKVVKQVDVTISDSFIPR